MNERDVFLAALQLESPAQREAYLDRACGGDKALRDRVAALFEAHERAGSFLQNPVLGPLVAAARRDHPTTAHPAGVASLRTDRARDRTAETQAEAIEPAAPSLGFLAPPQGPHELGRLGHYAVLGLLGQGGMGMVFLAEDTRLQRPVALKVMRPELAANPEGRQRFLREAQAAAHVRSDRVVTIYHVDQEADLPYLVMELLRGRSLAQALEQQGRLPLGQGLQIARETAEGLAAAHACGLIHRDVKPGNIWLEEPSGRVKLLDFGLARARTGPCITQHHVIIGTPAYMSPEQAAGRPLDGRCDLFSLGAVLYHMLTGQQPFAGKDLMTVLSSLASTTPPPAAGLVPGLPAGVADLLDRLLAKDPAGRPASAVEVARAVLALEQEAATRAPATCKLPRATGAATGAIPSRRGVLPARRRRLAVVGGVGLACLALGLLVAVLSGAFQGRGEDGRPSPDAVSTVPTIPPKAAPGGDAKRPDPAGAASAVRPEVPPVRAFALLGHRSQVQGVAFTADSKTLVSGELGGKVLFWDVDRREKTFEILIQPTNQLQSLAVDAQRRWLAVGQLNADIHLFRFGEPVAVGLLKGHTDRVVQLVFLKDGRTLLSTGYDGSIRRWDAETQKEGKPLRGPGQRIDNLAVWEDNQGGLRIAYTSYRKDAFGFVALDDMELERLRVTPDRVAFSPAGKRLACTAGANNGVALWALPDKMRLGLLPEAPFPRGLAFTPDGKHVVVEGADHTRIYATASGKPVARVDHAEMATYDSLAVSPDGRWLAIGTLRGSVRVWHLPSLLPKG